MWGREKIVEAAKELANHLQMVEHVKALQQGQKEISLAVASLNDRISEMEVTLRALKAETKLEAIRETQAMVNAVQGRFYERLEGLSIKVAAVESRALDHEEQTSTLRKLR
jgi:cell fate (sporulation/competence/biofilm development) regulator YmcA (YheA/YmcA/DUF963 family)